MPTAAKKTRRVAKSKVVPQTGGLWPFGSKTDTTTTAPADPNAPVAPVVPEGEKKGLFSGWFGSKTEPEGEKKGLFSGWFGSKTEPAAAPAVPATQAGGKKRTVKKATTKSKSKK